MRASSVLKFLDSFESYASQLLLVFFVCTLFSQIFLRVVFNHVLPWSEEISRFAFVWFVFFGASYAARLGAHNRVTVQFSVLPKWSQKYCLLLADAIWICFNLVMLRESIKVIQDLSEFPFRSPALGLSMEFVYWIFPISFVLMTIRIIQVNYMRYVLNIELADVDKVDADVIAEQLSDTQDSSEESIQDNSSVKQQSAPQSSPLTCEGAPK